MNVIKVFLTLFFEIPRYGSEYTKYTNIGKYRKKVEIKCKT